MHGSIWPAVLPYCVANLLLTLLCSYYVYPRFLEGNGEHAVYPHTPRLDALRPDTNGDAAALML